MNKKGLIAKALSFLPRSKRLEGILLVMATLVTSILEALGISLILPILTLTLDGNLDQLQASGLTTGQEVLLANQPLYQAMARKQNLNKQKQTANQNIIPT